MSEDIRTIPTAPGEGDEASRLYALANVLAHEIRNPLNALLMNLKILEGMVAHAKGQEIIKAAAEQAKRTNKILTEFLKFARPQKPEPSYFSILDLLNNIKTFVAPQLLEKGITLHIKSDDGSSELYTDRDMLAQILLNLVLNSKDAAATGNIYIQIANEDGTTSVSVCDDGPGFLEPDRAFEPFYSTKADGVGLGLPTVETLVSALGGSIGIGNVPGSGARVEVRLPDYKTRLE